jgi:endonuclease YncB( thermonuclease family)
MSKLFRLTLLIIVGALLAPVPAAQAKSGPCMPEYPHGAQCTVWHGKVRYVDDGDTLDADVPGDGLGGLLRIRVIGIQAMEQTSYRAAQRAGYCHALDATNRLEQLIKRSKKKIRVASLYPESRSRGRRLRSVAVRYGGRWHDVGRTMIMEGHALWWPGQAEDATNVRYSILAQRAAAAHKGLYSSNYCGIGPNEGHSLRLYANWDADGSDSEDVNGEWVKIRNLDTINPLPLGGWFVRDSSLRRFTFPPAASIPPNSSVTVYVGQGEPLNGEYYWNLTTPIFDNLSEDDRGRGDGAYLFDPQGDVRAMMVYPCRINCTDPFQGQVSIDVNPKKDEIMTLRNNAAAAIDLEDYQLKSKPYTYSFPAGSILQPGETMRVSTQGDPGDDTQFDKDWGMTSQILNNGGDSVMLVGYNGVRLACTAWGSTSC